ncbi:MAG: GerAB/ArcD/ProY family transporter [Clostridia bacterium]|nr:GerAB/ArcD/ProY family transporter [Clostridia bacterium]MCI8273965.1 GerAB/ArcD/ProY family transporter [Clostridia bacterium]
MLKSKIGTFEAIMLILTIVVTHTILSLPRNLLITTKSATIINLIYVSIIAIIISYLICKLLRNFPSLDIIDISETLGGKVFKNIIGIIFIVYFISSSSILLRNFCECLKIIYYPMTDITFILLMFVVAVCLANRLDFSATLKTNLLVIPLVLFSMVFLFVANTKNFSPQRIFPILGDGIFNTFVTGLGNITAFAGIVYLYFIPPYLKEPQKLKKIVLASTGISAIYLILCVSTILFMFSSFIIANEISSLYSATRYIEFGSFFQRLESVFLLIWILAFASYLSIVLKFTMNIFKKVTNIKTKKPLIDIFGLLMFGIAMLPENLAISEKFENTIYPSLVIGIVFALGLSILILANIKHKKGLSNEKNIT